MKESGFSASLLWSEEEEALKEKAEKRQGE